VEGVTDEVAVSQLGLGVNIQEHQVAEDVPAKLLEVCANKLPSRLPAFAAFTRPLGHPNGEEVLALQEGINPARSHYRVEPQLVVDQLLQVWPLIKDVLGDPRDLVRDGGAGNRHLVLVH